MVMERNPREILPDGPSGSRLCVVGSVVGHYQRPFYKTEPDSDNEDSDDGQPNYNANDNLALPDTTQCSNIPSNTDWPGAYDFSISFQEQTEKMTKSTSWTYSDQLDKLFINMGVSCILCFRVQKFPPQGCIIRALPIFDKSDHVINVVKRCPTHCLLTDQSNIGHSAPEHLVRCDSELSEYCQDPNNGRQSVIVPFMPPQAGTDSSQYLYKFMCLGSCVGGLNRRPLKLIFTLEKDGQVLGRRALKVRICACPGRDRKSEESHALLPNAGPTKKTKNLAQTTTADILLCEPANKKLKFDDELFTLTIRGRTNYEVLLRVKEALELSSLVPKDAKNAYYDDQRQMRNPSSILAARTPAFGNRLAGPSTSCETPSTSASQPNRQLPARNPITRLPSLLTIEQKDSARITSENKPCLKKFTSIRNEATSSASEAMLLLGKDLPKIDSTSANIPATSSSQIKKEPMELTSTWLCSINMACYVDLFAEKGLKYMRQLEELIEDDIYHLRIGEAHQAYIWKALLEYKGLSSCSPPNQPSSQGSRLSFSQQSSNGQPSVIQISRYRFKRVTSVKNMDHDYTGEFGS